MLLSSSSFRGTPSRNCRSTRLAALCFLVRATAVPRRRRGKSCVNHRDLRKRGRYFSDLDLRSRVSDDFRPPARRDGSKHILAGVRKRTGPTEGGVKRLSRRGLQFDSKPWRSAAPRGGRPQSSSSASPSALRLVDNPRLETGTQLAIEASCVPVSDSVPVSAPEEWL